MKEKKTTIKMINIVCILVLTVIVLPLLLMGDYNYPSADDWSFGAATHQTIEEGGNIFDVLKTAFDVAMYWRENGEPRYANAFLGALQPGIWGEQYYCVTPWILIGSLILAEIWLGAYLLKDKEGKKQKMGIADCDSYSDHSNFVRSLSRGDLLLVYRSHKLYFYL